MKIEAKNITEYIAQLPENRKTVFQNLRSVILDNIPSGFEEMLLYKMPSYVVPLSVYPDGYHCSPNTPLPFISIASQKNHIALYHMGIYAHPELKAWFENAYPKYCKYKLDMSKSCIRFKKMEDIPFELIAELIAKISAEQWVEIYEKAYKK